MTTVAYDGLNLAYDSQMSYHAGNVEKVWSLPDGSVVGGAGDYSKIIEAIAFLSGVGDKPSGAAGEVELIRIHNKRVMVSIDYGATWMQINDKQFAIGSGGAYAMGAMFAGKTAKDAVKIASKLDSGTGGKIRSMVV